MFLDVKWCGHRKAHCDKEIQLCYECMGDSKQGLREDIKVTLEIDRVKIAVLILPRVCLRTEQWRHR